MPCPFNGSAHVVPASSTGAGERHLLATQGDGVGQHLTHALVIPQSPMLHSLSAPELQGLQEHNGNAKISAANIKPWQMKRPIIDGCPKMKRRQLRQQHRQFTLQEVQEHIYVDDIWIAVDGKVYDITEHLVNHPGWQTAGVTTPLSILAHAGIDCSEEFHQIHRPYPIAYKQLAAFYIGDLASTS